jgi:putative serine protease PepD
MGDSAPGRPAPSSRGRRAAAAAGVLALVLGAGTGGALIALALDDDPEPPAATSLNATATANEAGSSGDSEPDEPLSQVADAVLPSVVSITIDTSRGEGQGSGVVISDDGLILTNNHVAAEAGNGAEMSVAFSDGQTADADVVGTDPASDLAVIQAQDVSGLTPATLGSSDDLHVGDTVLAIGSPLGLDGSVTSGIVSALNRAINLGGAPESPFGGPPGSTTAVIDAIQTDAAINPGNSGGALINAQGEVIGINTAIASTAGGMSARSGNIGVGFAIPIDDARSIAQQLIDDGEATHAYLGVQIADADSGGALIGNVEAESPAGEAGLQEGDIVTAVDGDTVRDATDLTAAIRGHAPGDQVELTYTRDGDESTAQVTLGTLPGD